MEIQSVECSKPKVVEENCKLMFNPQWKSKQPVSFQELMALAQENTKNPGSLEKSKKKSGDRLMTQEEKEHQGRIRRVKQPSKAVNKPNLAPHPTRPKSFVSVPSCTSAAPMDYLTARLKETQTCIQKHAEEIRKNQRTYHGRRKAEKSRKQNKKCEATFKGS